MQRIRYYLVVYQLNLLTEQPEFGLMEKHFQRYELSLILEKRHVAGQYLRRNEYLKEDGLDDGQDPRGRL
jgi:hypothetical protein